jgi:hypothetical protein
MKAEIKKYEGRDDVFYRYLDSTHLQKDSLENLMAHSIDIFDDYLQELAGGKEGIENRLEKAGAGYEITEEDGNIIVKYNGVNATTTPHSIVADQYDGVLVVFEGEIQGDNFYGDGAIVKCTKIVEVIKL